jgi:hypothetical protein
MNFKLREYQQQISKDASSRLADKGLVYLAMKPRTGKTFTSFEICKINGYKNVLLITKKNAISSIEKDYQFYSNYFKLVICNKEVHLKCKGNYDCVILDEAHQYGAFPKPGKYQKELKDLYSSKHIIFLSGTPAPESYSQIYHQLQISDKSPFKNYPSFYKWAKDFVQVEQKRIGAFMVNDYSKSDTKKIKGMLRHYFFTYTQEEAGFKVKRNELCLYVDMRPKTYKVIETLLKDKVVIGKSGQIVADSAAKLQQKVHQLSSGTIILEDGKPIVIDRSKAEFIKENFKDKKIAIFYKFKAELQMLIDVLGSKLTFDLDEFNSTDKWIAYQFVSGREGVKLNQAEALVFINIDFSCVSYEQATDRMVTIDREENNIIWIFSKGGIEEKIYQRVIKKQDYSNEIFKKDYGIKLSNKSKEVPTRGRI